MPKYKNDISESRVRSIYTYPSHVTIEISVLMENGEYVNYTGEKIAQFLNDATKNRELMISAHLVQKISQDTGVTFNFDKGYEFTKGSRQSSGTDRPGDAPLSFVRLSGTSENIPQPERLFQTKHGVAREINPYYKQELLAFKLLINTNLDANRKYDGPMIIEDFHGSGKKIDEVKQMINSKKLSWLAMEMLPESFNPLLDTFHASEKDSSNYIEARRKLLDYFSSKWLKFGDEMRGEKNLYFSLIDYAKNNNLRVYALDVEHRYYQSIEMTCPLALATRNLVWAKNSQNPGQGLVFGGYGHFDQHVCSVTFQKAYDSVCAQGPICQPNPGSALTLYDAQLASARPRMDAGRDKLFAPELAVSEQEVKLATGLKKVSFQ